MDLKIHKSITEDELIAKCRKGDSKAQASIYKKYSSRMLATCMRYIKERNEAEDTLIQGFMKAFSKIDQFKKEGSFDGWLRRIMVNESLTYLRRNKSMYLEVDIEKADKEPDYNTLSTRLEAEDLMKMIEDLPVGYRTIFNLYAIEGYSHKEICEQLGITINTSKSQLSRARKMLQSMLLKSENMVIKKLVHHE
ncbi:MAG: sigma-70 family RNA polymerase sigma factor [Cyclobacteriaceae bacterium]|nr:sigma-70 family RNA polymerase sigma factor [Cyclobacteriaceae bacterium]